MTRLLLTSSPSVGHTLPLRAIGLAAVAAGHEAAVLTAGPLASLVEPLPLLAVGPDWDELGAENARRHPGGVGSDPAPLHPTPADIGDFFARTRLSMAAGDAERAARRFAPDLIVAEAADSLGPFLAAALGVPWAAHGFGTEVPEVFASAMHEASLDAFAHRGVTPTARIAYLDPWPDVLHSDTWAPPADRITLDIAQAENPATSWQPPPRTGRHRVLVTFGTTVDAPRALDTVLRSLLDHTAAELIVTRGVLPEVAVRDPRVHEVGFVPYPSLLAAADLVVAAGGAGTTLGAMTAAKPMVFLPFFPDHHWQGNRVAAIGAGEVLADAADAGTVAARVLADPGYRTAAGTVAAAVAALGSPHDAWLTLTARTVPPA